MALVPWANACGAGDCASCADVTACLGVPDYACHFYAEDADGTDAICTEPCPSYTDEADCVEPVCVWGGGMCAPSLCNDLGSYPYACSVKYGCRVEEFTDDDGSVITYCGVAQTLLPLPDNLLYADAWNQALCEGVFGVWANDKCGPSACADIPFPTPADKLISFFDAASANTNNCVMTMEEPYEIVENEDFRKMSCEGWSSKNMFRGPSVSICESHPGCVYNWYTGICMNRECSDIDDEIPCGTLFTCEEVEGVCKNSAKMITEYTTAKECGMNNGAFIALQEDGEEQCVSIGCSAKLNAEQCYSQDIICVFASESGEDDQNDFTCDDGRCDYIQDNDICDALGCSRIGNNCFAPRCFEKTTEASCLFYDDLCERGQYGMDLDSPWYCVQDNYEVDNSLDCDFSDYLALWNDEEGCVTVDGCADLSEEVCEYKNCKWNAVAEECQIRPCEDGEYPNWVAASFMNCAIDVENDLAIGYEADCSEIWFPERCAQTPIGCIYDDEDYSCIDAECGDFEDETFCDSLHFCSYSDGECRDSNCGQLDEAACNAIPICVFADDSCSFIECEDRTMEGEDDICLDGEYCIVNDESNCVTTDVCEDICTGDVYSQENCESRCLSMGCDYQDDDCQDYESCSAETENACNAITSLSCAWQDNECQTVECYQIEDEDACELYNCLYENEQCQNPHCDSFTPDECEGTGICAVHDGECVEAPCWMLEVGYCVNSDVAYNVYGGIEHYCQVVENECVNNYCVDHDDELACALFSRGTCEYRADMCLNADCTDLDEFSCLMSQHCESENGDGEDGEFIACMFRECEDMDQASCDWVDSWCDGYDTLNDECMENLTCSKFDYYQDLCELVLDDSDVALCVYSGTECNEIPPVVVDSESSSEEEEEGEEGEGDASVNDTNANIIKMNVLIAVVAVVFSMIC